MIFPAGGEPVHPIVANDPLRPSIREEVLVIGLRSLGQRHQHNPAVEELEHRCDGWSVKVADEGYDISPIYRAEIQARMRRSRGDVIECEIPSRADEEWIRSARVSLG